MIEGLEDRVVLSSGPALLHVDVLGAPQAATAVVLTFSSSLDPTTAQNVSAYSFGKPPAVAAQDDGFGIGDVFGFRVTGHRNTPAVKKPKLVKNGRIVFSSAVYDDTAHTVTLTALGPFKAQAFFKYLRVKGTGPNAVKDSTGVALNGGEDTVAHWQVRSAKTITYVDDNHDHVTFKLKGKGNLLVMLRRHGVDRNPVIFVRGATATTTVIGKVVNPKNPSAVVSIAELEGAGGVTNNLVNNPSFIIQSTQP